MRVNTILYCIKQGLLSIKRNKLFSLASMITISACIFVFGIFYSLVTNIQATAKNAEETIGITVFFNEDLTAENIAAIGEEILAKPEVAYAVYVSPEEAWENFKDKYFEGSEELAAGFENDNPLAKSASYEIHLKDASKQNDFVAFLKSIDGIRKVNYSELAAGGLSSLNILIGYISTALVVILLFISLLLISNTITLSYTVRKDEIEITKWLGATNAFVRAPFIVEGLAIGIVGSVIPLTMLLFLYRFTVSFIEERFGILNSSIIFVPSADIFKVLLPVSLVLGLMIGFVGSFLTIRKNLKV